MEPACPLGCSIDGGQVARKEAAADTSKEAGARRRIVLRLLPLLQHPLARLPSRPVAYCGIIGMMRASGESFSETGSAADPCRWPRTLRALQR